MKMINYGLKPFRFENMWALHPYFKSMVEDWWKGCVVDGDEKEGFNFTQKLKIVKKNFIERNIIALDN